MIPEIEEGKAYLVSYVLDPGRKNAKTYDARVHILAIRTQFGRTEITTNRRPWDEGGTGTLYLEQILSAVEIPRRSA